MQLKSVCNKNKVILDKTIQQSKIQRGADLEGEHAKMITLLTLSSLNLPDHVTAEHQGLRASCYFITIIFFAG